VCVCVCVCFCVYVCGYVYAFVFEFVSICFLAILTPIVKESPSDEQGLISCMRHFSGTDVHH